MGERLWGLPQLQILGLFCGDGPKRPMTGYAVHTETLLPVPTVYRVIEQFEEKGFLVGRLERVDPTISQRTPRTVYVGTTVGADQLNAIRALVGVAA